MSVSGVENYSILIHQIHPIIKVATGLNILDNKKLILHRIFHLIPMRSDRRKYSIINICLMNQLIRLVTVHFPNHNTKNHIHLILCKLPKEKRYLSLILFINDNNSYLNILLFLTDVCLFYRIQRDFSNIFVCVLC